MCVCVCNLVYRFTWFTTLSVFQSTARRRSPFSTTRIDAARKVAWGGACARYRSVVIGCGKSVPPRANCRSSSAVTSTSTHTLGEGSCRSGSGHTSASTRDPHWRSSGRLGSRPATPPRQPRRAEPPHSAFDIPRAGRLRSSLRRARPGQKLKYAAYKRAAKTQPPRAAAAHHAESINALACDVRASVDVGFAHGCAGAAFLGADIWLSVGHAHDSNHLQAEHGQAHADANANARVLRAIVRTIAADVSAAQTLESACYCRL